MELTVDQIIAAPESNVAEVAVQEWGGSVFVRRLSALESLKLFIELRNIPKADDLTTAHSRLVQALSTYLCDSTGKPIATLEQARAIAGKGVKVVDRIVTAGHKLNAIDDESLDTTAKNSAPSLDATLPSA
jgi:hypothetical protein